MNQKLSNTYYIKALEAYPYDLSEVLESLQYALSCHDEHAGAHCLMGRLCMEYLNQQGEAENHFELALAADMNLGEIYVHYSLLLIQIGSYDKARSLLRYAMENQTISHSLYAHRMGLVYEHQGLWEVARKYMKEAYLHSCLESERSMLKAELGRVRSKLNSRKKKKRKKNKVR